MRLVRIRFVALDAQHGRIKFGRSDARWVIHVLRQRPVASFTGDAGVLPGSFLFENFGVTRLTRSMTRERHRLGRDFYNRIAAIMSILAKAAWHQAKTHDSEHRNSG